MVKSQSSKTEIVAFLYQVAVLLNILLWQANTIK